MTSDNANPSGWSRRRFLGIVGWGAAAVVVGADMTAAAASSASILPTQSFGSFTRQQLIDICLSRAASVDAPAGSTFEIHSELVQSCADPSRWLVYLEGCDVVDGAYSSDRGALVVVGGSPQAPQVVLTTKGVPLAEADLEMIRGTSGEGGD